MISFKTAKRLFSKVIYSPRGYLVPRLDGRILSGATIETVGFDKSVTAEGIDFVHQNALEIAPMLANLEISEKWAGLRPAAGGSLSGARRISRHRKSLRGDGALSQRNFAGAEDKPDFS
jgi:glycine/D-amino acid oxidase-like deaminating enzyme